MEQKIDDDWQLKEKQKGYEDAEKKLASKHFWSKNNDVV